VLRHFADQGLVLRNVGIVQQQRRLEGVVGIDGDDDPHIAVGKLDDRAGRINAHAADEYGKEIHVDLVVHPGVHVGKGFIGRHPVCHIGIVAEVVVRIDDPEDSRKAADFRPFEAQGVSHAVALLVMLHDDAEDPFIPDAALAHDFKAVLGMKLDDRRFGPGQSPFLFQNLLFDAVFPHIMEQRPHSQLLQRHGRQFRFFPQHDGQNRHVERVVVDSLLLFLDVDQMHDRIGFPQEGVHHRPDGLPGIGNGFLRTGHQLLHQMGYVPDGTVIIPGATGDVFPQLPQVLDLLLLDPPHQRHIGIFLPGDGRRLFLNLRLLFHGPAVALLGNPIDLLDPRLLQDFDLVPVLQLQFAEKEGVVEPSVVQLDKNARLQQIDTDSLPVFLLHDDRPSFNRSGS